MRQQHLATVRPNIDTDINTAYAQHDLLFDWHRFEIPPGEACIKSFNIIMPGTNGSAGNAVDFTFFIARSVFGAAPPSLGTVNAAVNNAAGKIAFTGARNHIVYTQTVDASVMQSPSTYTQSYNIYTSTKMNTVGGTQAAQFENALQPGGVNIGNSKYTGNYNDSTATPGMNSFWIAAITNGAHDFGTGVLLNQEGRAAALASGGSISLTVDGTDADDVFSVGDDLIAADGAIVGTVLEITSSTIIVVNEVKAALEDDDELCVRNPIIFNFGIEY
tara:strand:+ start:635 stop:1459 length:825 start_codon:yes stop_codon:yes gene_type:complete